MLELEPHPTCGFVAETYRSPLKIPAGALPEAYEGNRPFGSALYFLVTPDAQIVMHRIRSDQLYHNYLGDPLEVLLLYPDGNGEVVTVGSNLQASAPSSSYQVARSIPRAWPQEQAMPCSLARSGPAWSLPTSNMGISKT